MSRFIAALFTIARMWKQLRCPPIDEWIKEMWYIYTMEYCACAKLLQLCLALCHPYGLQPVYARCPWDSPAKNNGVGCYALLQGIFPTQGLSSLLLMSPALAGRFFTTCATWEAHNGILLCHEKEQICVSSTEVDESRAYTG